jgi:hypothetical protein
LGKNHVQARHHVTRARGGHQEIDALPGTSKPAHSFFSEERRDLLVHAVAIFNRRQLSDSFCRDRDRAKLDPRAPAKRDHPPLVPDHCSDLSSGLRLPDLPRKAW